MDYAIVSIAALFAAGLTFFSGFGLGTILMPVFAIFFPVEVAIAATAVVHFANNLFKLALVGKDAHWPTVWRYGITAAVAAVVGALVLEWLGTPAPLTSYELGGRMFQVTIVKVVIAMVIAGFAVLEMSPGFEKATFRPRWLWVGGVVSGFFGGFRDTRGAADRVSASRGVDEGAVRRDARGRRGDRGCLAAGGLRGGGDPGGARDGQGQRD